MPGTCDSAARTPTEIKLRKQSRLLEVTFDDGSRFELPFEYLRVYSPSAEVRGHGPGQETLQLGKHTVGYPFDRSGRQLRGADWCSTTATIPASTRGATCTNSARREHEKWQHYLDRLAQARHRLPDHRRHPIKKA